MASQLPHEVGAKEPKRPDTKNDQSGSPRKAKVELLSVKDPEEKVDAGSDSIGLEQKLVQALSSKMEEGTVDWEKVLGVLRECPEATAMKEAVDMIRPYNPPRHVVEFFLSDLEGIAKLKTLLSFNNPPNELVDALVKTIPDDVLQSSFRLLEPKEKVRFQSLVGFLNGQLERVLGRWAAFQSFHDAFTCPTAQRYFRRGVRRYKLFVNRFGVQDDVGLRLRLVLVDPPSNRMKKPQIFIAKAFGSEMFQKTN